MSQNSDWKCDGIPKNGRTYEGLGFEHELKENLGDHCSICGLPKDSMVKPPPEHRRLWLYIIGVVFLGGVVIVAINPCLVERFFVKCPTELENRSYTTRYGNASRKASESLNKFLQSGDLKAMQAAQVDLNSVIAQLEIFKSLKNEKCCPITIYPLVEKDLPRFKANVVEMNAFISTEKLAVDADNLAQAAKTIDDLEKAKNGFKNAISSIDKLAVTPFLSEKINSKKLEYQKQMKAVEEKLQALNEKLKQEEIERQRIERQRQIEENKRQIEEENQRQRQKEEENFKYERPSQWIPPNPSVPIDDNLPSCGVALFGNCKP